MKKKFDLYIKKISIKLIHIYNSITFPFVRKYQRRFNLLYPIKNVFFLHAHIYQQLRNNYK